MMGTPVMAATTCYRHHDRATGASCTRCGKPICPDCMIEAPVGHHCPDCVREGNRGVRRVPRPSTAAATGLVCKLLVGANVLLYVVQQGNARFTARFDALPRAIADGEYYRMITAAFLHANILHLVFNMAALFIFGVQVEAALGRARFVSLYVLAAFGGSLASLLLAPPDQPSVGASGAIFGLFGAYFV